MTMQLGQLASPRASAGGDTIMRRLKRYLQLHHQATLGDLALHFDVPADAMRGMLQPWLRKGRVRKLDVQASCNLVCPIACDDTSMTIYEWVDAPSADPSSFTQLTVIQPGAPVGGGGCCSRR